MIDCPFGGCFTKRRSPTNSSSARCNNNTRKQFSKAFSVLVLSQSLSG